MGKEAYERLLMFDDIIHQRYHIVKELKFPFGNEYGWDYKYAHRSKHLCYAFFEKGAFNVMIQIGKNEVSRLLYIYESLSEEAQKL